MMLSESVRAEIRKWMDLYPAGRQRSAILPALYVIQREFGYCPVDAQNELAEMLDLEPAEVGAVVDFYHMFHDEPKGEYHVEVCTNVPCMLRGANQCMHHSRRKAGHPPRRKDTPTASSRSTTWNVLAPVAPRRWSCVTERKTGKIRYFEELDSAEDVEKMLGTCSRAARALKPLERWTPEGDPNGEGKAAGPYRIGGMEPRFLLGARRQAGQPQARHLRGRRRL